MKKDDYRLRLEELIDNLPKGNVSKKVIRGKTRYYLQKREGEHVRNLFIREADVETVNLLVEFRKKL